MYRTLRYSLCACIFAGCSSARIHELYHFAGKKGDETVNYYRVEVNGLVHGTQLRYLSGFFDSSALDRYFNTFTQPSGGAILPVADAGREMTNEVADPPEKDENEQRDADPTGKHRKLCLLLSQNSEAVAEQIGGIAQSEAFATIVGRLVFKDQLASASREKSRADRAERSAAAAEKRAKDLASLLSDDDDTKQELLRFVNTVAADLGAPTPFANFADAETWLQDNRKQLLEGTR